MKRILWYLRQLLPLTYVSQFKDGAGQSQLCVWKMWLGRCYNARWFNLAN